MSENANAPDMIRWSFSVEPERRPDIIAYLADLGPDVVALPDGQVHVSWDEPEFDLEEVAAEIWAIHGEPFDITQEEFARLGHFVIHHDDGEAQAA